MLDREIKTSRCWRPEKLHFDLFVSGFGDQQSSGGAPRLRAWA